MPAVWARCLTWRGPESTAGFGARSQSRLLSYRPLQPVIVLSKFVVARKTGDSAQHPRRKSATNIRYFKTSLRLFAAQPGVDEAGVEAIPRARRIHGFHR